VLQHVRFLIVGTKVDLMAGSWSEAEEKLKSIEADMRSVVISCLGVSAVNLTNVVFVTAMGAYPQYKRLRNVLKGLLKRLCSSIFQGDPRLLKMLRFPQEYRDFQKDVKKLSSLRPGLPIVELESVSGREYGLLAGSHSNAQSLQALQVLHDVGDVIFCTVSDGRGGSKACLCWQPQVVANVIAKFADPDNRLPIQRGCASRAALEDILGQFLQDSMPAGTSSKLERLRDASTLFNFLLALRVFAPVERPVAANGQLSVDSSQDGSAQFMIPSALKGRPSFWREVFGLEQEGEQEQASCFSCVRGVRFACMDAMITVAAFVRAMAQLCSNPAHMWGCAFSFQLLDCGYMFVRLAESRDFVDVVVLGSDMSEIVGEHVDEGFRKVTTLLRCSTSDPLLLCPHCCASDMFARSGAVHAFYREQIVLSATGNTQQQQQPVDVVSAAGSLQRQALPQTDADEAAVDRSVLQNLLSRSASSSSGSDANTITHQPATGNLSPGAGAPVDDLDSAHRAHNPPGNPVGALSFPPAPAVAVLNCSRYHQVTRDSLINGQCVGVIGSRDMPVLYPHDTSTRDSLPWTRVLPLGLIEIGEIFKVVPNSFFELTLQLKDGEFISQACMRSINDAIRSKATVCHLDPPLQREGCGPPLTQLKLHFSVGSEQGSGDSKKVVAVILCCRGACEIDSLDGIAVTTKCNHGLVRGARVMLSSGGIICRVSAVMSESKFVLVPEAASAPTLQLAAGTTIFPMLESFSFEDHVLVLYYPPQIKFSGSPVVDEHGRIPPESFFALTKQLKEWPPKDSAQRTHDEIEHPSARKLESAIASAVRSDGVLRVRVQQCELSAAQSKPRKAQDRSLKLRYIVGEEIAGQRIEYVFASPLKVELGSEPGDVATACDHGLKVGAKVLLSAPEDIGGQVQGVICKVSALKSNKILTLTREPSSDDVQLPLVVALGATIAPMLESFSVSDRVSVVLKQRPPFALFPGVTAQVHTLHLEPSDCSRSAEAACWRDVEDNWAIMLGNEFRNYEITGMTLFRCEDRERLFVSEVSRLTSIAPQRPHPDFSSPIDVVDTRKAKREALQQQVMGHFNDFSQKFSLLPSAENTDVNLSVAWWGKWPAIYHGAAQNGFWNLPSHLKIDPGYFGEGFYLTRYPRYSDYYINGFSLSKRKVDNGSILMCYAALGRPYPVTQDPFSPPDYTRGAPSPSSPCGKVCGAACGFSSSSGIDSHDSHYVTVKMHPQAGQYFPCPVRQQPDFDEIVVFNPDRILPVAYVTFQRRCCCRCCARSDAAQQAAHFG
jgi:hypothetical protein